MIKLTRKLARPSAHQATLTLPLQQRMRSRLRVTLDDGSEAGIFLDRGSVLREGDLLIDDEGFTVLVRAAEEPVSTVDCEDPLVLARLAYHLGNRHVPLQIEPTWVRYQHDHVLDDMVRGLGLPVREEQAPFEPEPGAYGGHHHHTHQH
jgi:urease accessory protein